MPDLFHENCLAASLRSKPQTVVPGPQAETPGQVARKRFCAAYVRPGLKANQEASHAGQYHGGQPLKLPFGVGRQVYTGHKGSIGQYDKFVKSWARP